MSFQDKVKAIVASIRNELERIEMHAEPSEDGGPDYDTIDSLTDLIEGHVEDLRDLIEEILEEAEG
uniref:Uncharacterized protein n=2 Tax=viral metagenome TaxID=1070528 RepID=A0A6M3MA49_9ZZZZ